ncbi:MAG: DUF2891 domain-containing protein [Saprospiraceae bacterium]|nr:DUF2891 domain-containing protein [Saprospiraceae bacterium]
MKSLIKLLELCLLIGLVSCNEVPSSNKTSEKVISAKSIQLDLKGANNLIQLPLACVLQEYPNKLGQVVGDKTDLQEPSSLHPSFYGCFDWHSAVHGHWSLVKLLKEFPEIDHKEESIKKLQTTLTKENILKEIEYFNGKHNKSYERTYGWAWLLKLAEELHTWDHPVAKELEDNLAPLTELIVNKYLEFLPKLIYPIRVGEHTNTAFGLSFALDYAMTLQNVELENAIKNRAKDFYFSDSMCPLNWEPSGFDFLSPCLEEASLMSKVLDKKEFLKWVEGFLPQLYNPSYTITPGKVSDRTDGKLVHLDGLNFSRAWCLKNIAQIDKRFDHLIPIANEHINYSLPSLVGDSYEGGHWLGSFAIYACQ